MLETYVGDVSISTLVVPTIASPIQNFVTSDLQNLPHLQGLKLAHPFSSAEKLDISRVDHHWDIVGTGEEVPLQYNPSWDIFYQDHCWYNQKYSLHLFTQTLDLELANCSESLPNSCLSTPTRSQPGTEASQPSQSFKCLYQQNCISHGSCVVRFPWKENHPFLPSNFSICDHQTRALARRLACQPDLLRLYGQLISDQEERNFIEQAPNKNANGVHYIPHHPVRKNSPTTPIRIVYNCSCRQSPKHASLNDCLMVGDPALTDLTAIHLRFRLHCYALQRFHTLLMASRFHKFRESICHLQI